MNFVIIGFSKGKGPLANIIRFFTGSEITHTYIRHGSLITQASGFNVNIEHIQDFMQHAHIIDEILITLPEEAYQKAEEMRAASVNSPYSVLQLFGYLFILLGRRLGVNITNPFATGFRSFVCSELVARYLGLSNPEDLTPSDIYHILQLRR